MLGLGGRVGCPRRRQRDRKRHPSTSPMPRLGSRSNGSPLPLSGSGFPTSKDGEISRQDLKSLVDYYIPWVYVPFKTPSSSYKTERNVSRARVALWLWIAVMDQENQVENVGAVPLDVAKPEPKASSVQVPLTFSGHASLPTQLGATLTDALHAAVAARAPNPCSFIARYLREELADPDTSRVLPHSPPHTHLSASLSGESHFVSTFPFGTFPFGPHFAPFVTLPFSPRVTTMCVCVRAHRVPGEHRRLRGDRHCRPGATQADGRDESARVSGGGTQPITATPSYRRRRYAPTPRTTRADAGAAGAAHVSRGHPARTPRRPEAQSWGGSQNGAKEGQMVECCRMQHRARRSGRDLRREGPSRVVRAQLLGPWALAVHGQLDRCGSSAVPSHLFFHVFL